MKTRLIKASEVKPQELARIVNIIKGFNTSAELAKALKVNPSTTSRILNGKISGPISEDTIRKLADMITPDMGVTREELFDANGMTENDGYQGYFYMSRFEDRNRMEYELGSVITKDVANRGGSMWRYAEHVRYRLHDMLSFSPNLVLECEKCHNEKHPYNDNWAFFYLEVTPYVAGRSSWDVRTAMRFMERVSYISLMYQQVDSVDAQYDEEFQELPAKISGVVYRPELYDIIIKKYEKLRVPVPTSLVLVNLDTGMVEKEFPFVDLNGYRYSAVFDGSYFDDDDNSITEEEYEHMLDDMVDEYIKSEKKEDNE